MRLLPVAIERCDDRVDVAERGAGGVGVPSVQQRLELYGPSGQQIALEVRAYVHNQQGISSVQCRSDLLVAGEGEDFVEPGQEILLDPQDYYLPNGRSTVLLLGRRM